MTRFRQIEGGPRAWPEELGRIAAIISPSPEDLADWSGLEFFEDYDELDYYRGTLFRVDAKPYALIRHRGTPAPGTELWIPRDSTEPRADIRKCLRALGLTEEVITWELDMDSERS